MLNYQANAIKKINENAEHNRTKNFELLNNFCQSFGIELHSLCTELLNRDITINFHPDRLSYNKKIVIDSLYDDGKYHGQFITQTTNGGNTAFIGGQRYIWEQEMFFNIYPESSTERPKYGALNILNYVDGATARFGSSYFVLNKNVLDRCSFAYGDSSISPKGLCTANTFEEIVINILHEIQNSQRVLNRITFSDQEALSLIMHNVKNKFLGRCLDHYIETHVHGDIDLANDVDIFYLDSSFKSTPIEFKAQKLCNRYGITLCFIPKREMKVKDIDALFRGDKIRPLAELIDNKFADNKGVINAYLIGLASQSCISNSSDWITFGDSAELFQYIKQLWHTVAYYG